MGSKSEPERSFTWEPQRARQDSGSFALCLRKIAEERFPRPEQSGAATHAAGAFGSPSERRTAPEQLQRTASIHGGKGALELLIVLERGRFLRSEGSAAKEADHCGQTAIPSRGLRESQELGESRAAAVRRVRTRLREGAYSPRSR